MTNRLRLSPAQIAEVRRIRHDLRTGKTRLATLAEVAKLKRQLLR
jgi:hypothetical protein